VCVCVWSFWVAWLAHKSTVLGDIRMAGAYRGRFACVPPAELGTVEMRLQVLSTFGSPIQVARLEIRKPALPCIQRLEHPCAVGPLLTFLWSVGLKPSFSHLSWCS
jgi:hypothetical protein